jgi:hypothetical protein
LNTEVSPQYMTLRLHRRKLGESGPQVQSHDS